MKISSFNFNVAEPQGDNTELFEAIYRLRYQVYVSEWEFEKLKITLTASRGMIMIYSPGIFTHVAVQILILLARRE